MRIRSVKPEFWTDRICGRWPADLKLFYVGLWNFADDDGRFEWEPQLIRAALYPFHPQTNVDGMLCQLRASGRVASYVVAGQRYGHIPRFREHQHPDKPRSSQLPEPTAENVEGIEPEGGLPEDSPRTPRGLPEDSPLDRIGSEGIGGDSLSASDEADGEVGFALELQDPEPEKSAKMEKRPPLPFSREQIFDVLARTSGGRFVPAKVRRDVAIGINQALRELADDGATLDDFGLVGEYVRAWGVECQLGPAWIARTEGGKGLRPTLPLARSWAARGRPPLGARLATGSSAPVRAAVSETSSLPLSTDLHGSRGAA